MGSDSAFLQALKLYLKILNRPSRFQVVNFENYLKQTIVGFS